MSGHNKWSSIKHRKGAQDAKRGAIFNKIIRELVVAAKEGGADPTVNFSLSAAIEKAKAANMPKDTMERAIKRGAGGSDGENYERISYEGRGPAGTAMIVHTLTDNKNRTVADLRNIFKKGGGELGTDGSVAWMFERKGVINLENGGFTEDELIEDCLEAGAEAYKIDGDVIEVTCEVDDLEDAKQWFRGNDKYKMQSSSVAMVAKDAVDITDASSGKQVFRLLELLDDNDDVQMVFSNWSMTDELMEQIASEG
ncbi:YebC/PmpR family DNA-binding transcriptional regulator [bacterium]|nr:YebC/PmpR family DNA-binding transcriptional regulator [bacterium]